MVGGVAFRSLARSRGTPAGPGWPSSSLCQPSASGGTGKGQVRTGARLRRGEQPEGRGAGCGLVPSVSSAD